MATSEVQSLYRILLIEDTYDDERLSLRAVRACGHPLAIRVVRDGLLARKALGIGVDAGQLGLAVPDLVISDLKLPGLNGDQLLCYVRKDARLAKVPYVIFSSSNEPEDIRRCLERGANAFVQKPVDFNDYFDCLQSVVHWCLEGFRRTEMPLYVLAAADSTAGFGSVV